MDKKKNISNSPGNEESESFHETGAARMVDAKSHESAASYLAAFFASRCLALAGEKMKNETARGE